MTSELTHLLLETGILQFGWFEEKQSPFQLKLDLLPSYPDVLDRIVEAAAPLVGEVDHLISAVSSMPFGVGLSLKIGVPLVYSQGTDDAPVYDLVGAYDIGHPAVLLANHLRDAHGLIDLAHNARRVGLEAKRLLVIVNDGVLPPDSLRVTSLLNLPTIVDNLVASGYLPAGHGKAVASWFQQRDRINPHPG